MSTLDLTYLNAQTTEQALHDAYRTRDGAIAPLLTPIEQVGIRVALAREQRHVRLNRYELARWYADVTRSSEYQKQLRSDWRTYPRSEFVVSNHATARTT